MNRNAEIINHSRRSRKRPAGFTLVELLAIIVIVGIMAGVAIPAISSIGTSRARMAAKQVLRDLTFARQRAIATGTTSWVTFNTGSGTWAVQAENPANPGKANASTLNDSATGKTYTTTLGVGDYIGVSFSSANFGGGSDVGFNWLGKPLNSGGGALASQGSVVISGGGTVTVATTGLIRHVP